MEPRRRWVTLAAAGCAVVAALAVWRQWSRERRPVRVEAGVIPENAPHECPGVDSIDAGNDDACAGCPNRSICASGSSNRASEDVKAIAAKLKDIKRIILVLSGKGGVGKSSMATQIAYALERRGNAVGLMDIDICGPSIPRMTGTRAEEVKPFSDGWLPVVKSENLLVMSAGFLLPEEDGAVIWRGPKKNGLIKQFLTDVYWGSLDYLIVDTPPGTSDEHLSIVTYLKEAGIAGAILVTTPQEVALQDVRKEINFCKQTNVPVLGLIENMSDSVFASSEDAQGSRDTCRLMDVPFAGKVSLDRAILDACEHGSAVPANSPTAQQIEAALDLCLTNIRS